MVVCRNSLVIKPNSDGSVGSGKLLVPKNSASLPDLAILRGGWPLLRRIQPARDLWIIYSHSSDDQPSCFSFSYVFLAIDNVKAKFQLLVLFKICILSLFLSLSRSHSFASPSLLFHDWKYGKLSSDNPALPWNERGN